jgi:predicted DNA-binding transcriptional regulator YafY
MRADRLVSILLLLQIYRRLTAGELARRLEVSERTILRDMDALSTAGVPVLAERGARGGWSLVEGYRTNLTGLAAEEIQALFLAGPSRLLKDLKLGKAAESGLVKLLAALPSAHRRDAEFMRQRIHVDVTGWSGAEEAVPCLATIQEAVWRERRLRISYDRGEDCAPFRRLVDPLGLVAKGSVWYLLAAVEGQVRTYRVSRVREAEVVEETFERPADFDLAAHWAESSARFKTDLPRYDARFRAHSADVRRLRYAVKFSRVLGVGEPDADGRVEVSMRFQFEEEACEFALGLGPRVEVIEPAELREKTLRRAEAVVALYAG